MRGSNDKIIKKGLKGLHGWDKVTLFDMIPYDTGVSLKQLILTARHDVTYVCHMFEAKH